MGSEKKFVFESLQDIKSICTFLDAITDGMKTGKILLASNDELIEMHPSGLLHMSLKAKKKGNNNKVSLKIEWKESSPHEHSTILSVGK